MTSHRQASSNGPYIPAGQSVSGVQIVLSPSFLPTGGAEQEKEGPDIVHVLLGNHQNCCVTSTLPVTPKTWDALKEVTSITARLCMLPKVYESTKANFYILTLEKGPTNDETGKVKIWV